MSSELFHSFIKEFGALVNLPNLQPDDDNYCCVGFDESIITHIQYNDTSQSITLFSELGKLNPSTAHLFYPKLLNANLFWQDTNDATIGVDESTLEVLLCYQAPIHSFDSSKFQKTLETFVNTSETWINIIQNYSPQDSQTPDSPPPSSFEGFHKA